MSNEVCRDCGNDIGPRARANIWHGERILCSDCYRQRKQREAFEARVPELRAAMVGWPDKPWFVKVGEKQLGPYTTECLVGHLRAGRIDWLWKVWRDGMKSWKPAAQLFTNPELADDGQVRLREFIHLNEYQAKRRRT
jgi:hypothetical protein